MRFGINYVMYGSFTCYLCKIFITNYAGGFSAGNILVWFSVIVCSHKLNDQVSHFVFPATRGTAYITP